MGVHSTARTEPRWMRSVRAFVSLRVLLGRIAKSEYADRGSFFGRRCGGANGRKIFSQVGTEQINNK